jgi:hypothetical protein
MTILAPLGGALDGTLGGIASGNPIGGLISGATSSAGSAVLQWISSWVLKGTSGAIEEVASAIGAATAPNLNSTWFSSTYWRVAALAAMLTIPFLCAAAVEAVARADLGLLVRVAFGYLPLSILGVSLAAPLTMLLLAATDQMSAAVSAGAATGGARFLNHAAEVAGALATASGGSPFFAVAVGMLALMAAMALAVELLVRAAAVYIVVLMLPLAFAALVWPARRIWAVRLVELLTSLILSKFVIVAVLSLAGAAFASGTSRIGDLLVAMSLILLSTFAPWALMRMLPFTELAAGAAGILRNELPVSQARSAMSDVAGGAGELAMELPARLRNQARAMYAGRGGEQESAPAADAMPAAVATAAGGGSAARNEGSGEPSGFETGSSEPAVGSSEPNVGSSASNPGPSASNTGSSDERALFVWPAAWRGSEQRQLSAGLARAAAQENRPTPDQKEQP